MLHEVEQRRVGVVRRCDGGDLVVLIPRSSSSATTAASALTGVALKKQKRKKSVFQKSMKRKGEDRFVYLFWEQSRNKTFVFFPLAHSLSTNTKKNARTGLVYGRSFRPGALMYLHVKAVS